MKLLVACLLLMAMLSGEGTAQQVSALDCEAVRIEIEQLPDLNIPRYGHCIFFANGELTVVGGHTTGFVPTPTAEYFSDGAWHTVPMAYTHDHGMAVPMKSGKVLVCGGANEPLGIGQTYTAEWYDPATRASEVWMESGFANETTFFRAFKAIVGMTPSEKSLFILAAVAMLFTACMKENNEQTLADNTIVYDGVTMIHNEGETTDFRITFTVSGNTLTWNFNLREIILHKQ